MLFRSPNFVPTAQKAEPAPQPVDITRDEKKFLILIRNEVFVLVRALAIGDYERAAPLFARADSDLAWTETQLEDLMKVYYADHQRIRTDSPARSANFFHSRRDPATGEWEIEQILVDAEEKNDWALELKVDTAQSQRLQKPVLKLKAIRAL